MYVCLYVCMYVSMYKGTVRFHYKKKQTKFIPCYVHASEIYFIFYVLQVNFFCVVSGRFRDWTQVSLKQFANLKERKQVDIQAFDSIKEVGVASISSGGQGVLMS